VEENMNSVNIKFDNTAQKFNCNINGQKFKTTKKDYIEYMYKKITGEKKTFEMITDTQTPKTADKFCINTRFGFVEKLVNLVASGVQPSAVITGQGGLG
jgi:hypothetical protein